MRLLKSHSLLRLVNSYVIDSPQPANISYLWNFGSLLATCLVIQILTGCFLAMHYQSHVDFAFNSVEHIMRDVNNGWVVRYTHANVASFFFIFVYGHIGRGLYYSSYKSPRILVWSIGVIILILMMAIAFLGYIDNSPKWFYISISYLIILIVVYTVLKKNKILISPLCLSRALPTAYHWGSQRLGRLILLTINPSNQRTSFLNKEGGAGSLL